MHRQCCRAGMTECCPASSIRWGEVGGRGDELRLRGVVPGSPGTDQTLATVGGRPTSVNRHRSPVVGHSAHEGQHCSRCAWIHACRLQRCTAAGGRCAPLKSADTDPSTARAVLPRIFKFEMSENEDSDMRTCHLRVKQARVVSPIMRRLCTFAVQSLP